VSDYEPIADSDGTAPIIDGYGTGLLPSPPDPRDFMAADLLAATAEATRTIRTRASSDLASRMPPIWNQSIHGACTSSVTDAQVYVDKQTHTPSHAAQWAWTKLERGLENVAKNVGAGIRTAMDITRSHGVVPDTVYPFVKPNMYMVPSPEIKTQAEKNQTIAYFKVEMTDRAEILRVLGSLRLPIAFGMACWSGWTNVDDAGKVMRRPANPEITGYHLMLMAGFKTLASGVWVKVRNSYGLNFGGWTVGGVRYGAGYCWIHLDDLVQYGFDFYVIQSVEGDIVTGTNVPVQSFHSARGD